MKKMEKTEDRIYVKEFIGIDINNLSLIELKSYINELIEQYGEDSIVEFGHDLDTYLIHIRLETDEEYTVRQNTFKKIQENRLKRDEDIKRLHAQREARQREEELKLYEELKKKYDS